MAAGTMQQQVWEPNCLVTFSGIKPDIFYHKVRIYNTITAIHKKQYMNVQLIFFPKS